MRKTISIDGVPIGSAEEMIGPEDSISVFIWDGQIRKVFDIPGSQPISYKHGHDNIEF